MKAIDWESSRSYLMINPSYRDADKLRYSQILEAAVDYPGHIWLSTSGSTNQKWVGLSKSAILSSAEAVNEHLEVHSKDRWALALPTFHVGGLGILARSHLSGNLVKEFCEKWHAGRFHQFLVDHTITLTAMVPTQLFDLLHYGLSAPPHLRAVLIGGGKLMPELYEKSLLLGWNVLPSYGLTECGSQVATARPRTPDLKILKHLQVECREGNLAIGGSSLLSAYALVNEAEVEFFDPKVNGWFVSEDRGEVCGNHLIFFGRSGSVVKICGENVDLVALEDLLQKIRLQLNYVEDVVLVAVADCRKANRLVLAIEGKRVALKEKWIVDAFNQSVLPFEKISEVRWLDAFPRNALNKILRHSLVEKMNNYPSVPAL